MKLIDVEFANQTVAIPLYAKHTSMVDKGTVIEELINIGDVTREQRITAWFPGSLIPPSSIWEAASEKDARVP